MTRSHTFRKELLRPRRITIRKEIHISSAATITLHESRLIAEKEMAEQTGYRYEGAN